MAGKNTIVVRILGNSRGLSKSLKKAGQDVRDLNEISTTLGTGLKVATIGAAAFGAAAVGAGAAGAAALAAMPALIIGIGVLFLKNNARIKKSYGDLGKSIKKAMDKITKPLADALVRGVKPLQKAFDALVPSLKEVFKAAGPLVDDVFAMMVPLAKELGPLLVNGFKAGAPILEGFLGGLIPLTRGFGDFFKALGKNGPQFGVFVNVLMTGLGALLGPLGELIGALTPLGTIVLQWVIDGLTILAGVITNKVVPGVKKLLDFIKQYETQFKLAAAGIVAFFAALKAISLITALAGAFGALATPVGLVVAALVILAGVFVYLWKNNETFRTNVTKAWTEISAKISEVVNTVWPKVMAAFNAVKTWWDQNGPAVIAKIQAVFDYIARTAGPVVQQLVATLGTAFEAIKVAVTFIVGFLSQVWSKIAPVVVPILKALWEGILAIIRGALLIIQGILNVFIAIFTGNWSKAWTGVKQIVQGIWVAIGGIIKAAIASVRLTITVFLAVISVAWKTAWNAMKAFFGSIWSGIKQAVSAGVNAIKDYFAGLRAKILGALSGARSWLAQAGRDLISGLINGAKAMVGNLVSAVKGVAQSAIDAAKSILHIKSPSRVFRDIGKNVGKGLIVGIDSMSGKAAKASSSLAKAVSDGFSAPTLTLNARTAFADGVGTGGGINLTVVAPVGSSPADIGRELTSYLDAYTSIGGRRRS